MDKPRDGSENESIALLSYRMGLIVASSLLFIILVVHGIDAALAFIGCGTGFILAFCFTSPELIKQRWCNRKYRKKLKKELKSFADRELTLKDIMNDKGDGRAS